MRRWPGGAAAAPQRRDAGGSVEDYLSEKEQWEWIKTQVRENGPAVIVAVAVVAAGLYGWGWWQGHLDAGRLGAGAEDTPNGPAPGGGGAGPAPGPFGGPRRGVRAPPPH